MIFENTLGKFEPYMAKLNTFNLLKSIVGRCVNKDDTVETELLRGLIEQVKLRQEMLVGVSKQLGEQENWEAMRAIRDDALFDLSRTDPNEVAGALAEESQMLDELQEHMVELKEGINEGHEEMVGQFDAMKDDLQKIKRALKVKEDE